MTYGHHGTLCHLANTSVTNTTSAWPAPANTFGHLAGHNQDTENGNNWEWIAAQVKKGGAADLLKNSVMFSDRCKGAAKFSEQFPDATHAHCGEHLHRNSRESASIHKADKSYPKHLFWSLRGSRTSDEFKSNLKNLHNEAPSVATYLAKVDRRTWVYGDLLAQGRGTYRWQTSNQSEITNANMNKDRTEHPTRALERFVHRSSSRLCKERQQHKEDKRNKEVIVEHARAFIDKRREASKKCIVTQTGANTFTSQYQGAEEGNRSTRNSEVNPLTNVHLLRQINFEAKDPFNMCR